MNGSSLRARAGVPKAKGAAQYTEDFRPQGLLHCVAVRSPVASGRVVGIDDREALALDGVACVLTAANLPDRRWGTAVHDQPVLARDVVRFVGEPVALVAAESRDVAQRAASLVQVDIEGLPAVTRLVDAVRQDAWQVHEGVLNVLAWSSVRRGEVEARLRDAATVVETWVESHRVHQGYIEPRATLAELDDRQRLVVTTTSQVPFVVRQGLAALLGLPMSAITVRVPHLGGGFGGKLHLGLAAMTAAACLATGRPTRMVASRSEDMSTGNPRENSLIHLTSAVDGDGRITARRARIYLDAGAYAFDTPMIASIATMQGTGPYDVEDVDLAAAPVYTNTCPTGSFRAPSGPQMVYAVEKHMEDVAATVGTSRIDIRRINFLRSGAHGPTGQQLDDVGMGDCFEAMVARIEAWQRNAAPLGPEKRRGYGVACGWWLTSPAPSSATVTFNEDGTVALSTGGTEIGTGAVTSGAVSVVARTLGIAAENIYLTSGSTAEGAYDSGSKGSRTLYGVGNAARQAAEQVLELLRQETADAFEADPGDIVFRHGRAGVRGEPSSEMRISDVLRAATARNGPLSATVRFRGPDIPIGGATLSGMPFSSFNEPTFHCHAAEIDLNLETACVDVRRYAAAHDIGPVVDEEGARGQVEGGIVQGLGFALFEVLELDDHGAVRNPDLVDYRLPTVADIPGSIEIVFIDDYPAASGPFGAKGIGEAPVMLPAAVIGSAVRDILGDQPGTLPLDPIRLAAFLDRLEDRAEASVLRHQR